MKPSTLKANGQRRRGAFTIIELIGVLAVSVILASMIVIRATELYSMARVDATQQAYYAMYLASTNHYGQYHAFNIGMGTVMATPINHWETAVAIPEYLVQSPLAVPIGNGSCVQVVAGGGQNGNGYALNGSTCSTVQNAYTMELVITNVKPKDAVDLWNKLNFPLCQKYIYTVGQQITNGLAYWYNSNTNNGSLTNLMYIYINGD